MAQPATKPPQDQYAQRGKKLTSAVQRLRGWVGSDPARAPELADALVELTAHRLLGHGYSAAAADAQDAVRRAAQQLTANGPIGPYTSVSDAVRCITTLVHVATIQAGVGLAEASGRTIESMQDLRRQLHELSIEEQLKPQTAIWALSSTARADLASGNIAEANAYADAALARLAESGLRGDPDADYLTVDTDRLASDCRWAAGDTAGALSYLHAAKDRYDDLVAGRLAEPGRLSPALLERLAEPLFGLYRDMADRLVATGEIDLGLVTRRALADTLQGLVGRLGEPARVQLASAQADLARDLAAVNRVEEATAIADQAGIPVPTASDDQVRGVVSLGTQRVSWTPLPAAEAYAATTASAARAVDAADRPADPQDTAAWLEAERAEAHRVELARLEQARVDAERRAAERISAERAAAEQRAAEQAQAEVARRLEAERLEAAEEAERLARKRRREERLEAHRHEVERLAAEQREAERLDAERREAERLAADPVEAERLELARLDAELAELERQERAGQAPAAELSTDEVILEAGSPTEEPVEVVEGEPVEIEPEPAERAEPPAAAESQPADPEPELTGEATSTPEPKPTPEPEPDELAVLEQTWRDARERGDRRSARAANEQVVELLRVHASVDLAAYGPQLQDALAELASARLRGGDLWGSRRATKEAKAVAESLGR